MHWWICHVYYYCNSRLTVGFWNSLMGAKSLFLFHCVLLFLKAGESYSSNILAKKHCVPLVLKANEKDHGIQHTVLSARDRGLLPQSHIPGARAPRRWHPCYLLVFIQWQVTSWFKVGRTDERKYMFFPVDTVEHTDLLRARRENFLESRFHPQNQDVGGSHND